MNAARVLTYALPIGAIAIAAAWYWRSHQDEPVPPPSVPVASAPVQASAASAAVPAEPPPPQVAADQAVPQTGVEEALVDTFGRDAVRSMLQTGDFTHRVVATVDNLPRNAASARLWPVVPAPGHFKVRTVDGVTTIDPENAQRYQGFVRFAESVELPKVVDLYHRMYPLLQAAYEGIGYPNRQFHSRVIATIDHLLETPVPSAPLQVAMPEIRGPQPARPWVLYEFTDPQYAVLSAGQKLLLRMGPDNERRLQQRLRELRALLVAPQGQAAKASSGLAQAKR